MNIVEQLQAMGFREEPVQFYEDGGDVGADGSMGFGIEGGSYGGAGYGNVGYGGAGDVSPDALASIASANVAQSPGTEGGRAAQAALEALEAMGYGKMEGINAANPTQSVDNLLASFNTHAALNVAAPLIASLAPGYGLVSALGKGAQFAHSVASGRLSPQDALAELGLNLASAITGQSVATLAAAARGDFGTAAMSAAKGAITGALAQQTGLPAGVVGLGVNALGSGITSGGGMSGGAGSTDVAGGNVAGPDVMADGGAGSPGGFDMSALGPAFTVAALEDMFAPKETKEDKDKQNQFAVASPFGVMPYA